MIDPFSFPGSAWERKSRGSASRVRMRGWSRFSIIEAEPRGLRSQAEPGNEVYFRYVVRLPRAPPGGTLRPGSSAAVSVRATANGNLPLGALRVYVPSPQYCPLET